MIEDLNGVCAGLGVQAGFLFSGGKDYPADDTADKDQGTQPHIDQGHGQCPEDKPGQE